MGNTFTTTTAAAGTGMTLTDARLLFDTFSRLAGGSSPVFNPADRDRAILSVGTDFVEATRATLRTDTVAVAAGVAAASFAGVAGFRPERARRYYVAGHAPDLTPVDYAGIEHLLARAPRAGRPCQIAFSDWSAAILYPTPDADYTLSVAWSPQFTSFTAGTGAPDAVTFDVPDEWLRRIVEGACGKLMLTLKETKDLGAQRWADYAAWRDSMKGAGGTGAKVVFRDGPPGYRRRGAYTPAVRG